MDWMMFDELLRCRQEFPRGRRLQASPLACLLVLTLSLAPKLADAQAEPEVFPPDPLPLSWCLEQAQQRNPSIAVDAAAADAAARRIVPAGSLDDPSIGYEASNVPIGEWDFNSTPMSGQQLQLKQKLPFPGFLAAREKAARSGEAAALESLADRRAVVAAEVEKRWSELGFAQRALDITEANIDLLRQLTEIAETKYRVGSGRQQDVLRAQVELTRLLEEKLRRVAALRAAEAGLAAVLDLPTKSTFPRTTDLRDDSALPEFEPLLDRLEEKSPLLRALAAKVEEAERLRRTTELQGYPDFDLGVGYRIRERVPGDPVAGDDFVMAGVTVRMPINRTKWKEQVAEKVALVRHAKATYAVARANLREAARASFASLQRAQDEVTLLETGLVPQTRQSLESNRSGYRVDQVDFLSLVDSEIRLFNAELGLVRARANRRVAFAALERAIGEQLR